MRRWSTRRCAPARTPRNRSEIMSVMTASSSERHVSIAGLTAGNSWPLMLLGGMNVLESRELALEVAEAYVGVTAKLDMPFFFFKQKTAYEIGLGIPAEPLFRSDRKERFIMVTLHEVITFLVSM